MLLSPPLQVTLTEATRARTHSVSNPLSRMHKQRAVVFPGSEGGAEQNRRGIIGQLGVEENNANYVRKNAKMARPQVPDAN